jgi:hypothetical protein
LKLGVCSIRSQFKEFTARIIYSETKAVNQIVKGSNSVMEDQQVGTRNANSVSHPAIQEIRAKAESLPPEKREAVGSVLDHVETLIEKGPKTFKIIEATIAGLCTYWPTELPWLVSQAEQIGHFLGS